VSERKEEEDDGEGLTALDQGEIAHGVEQLSLGRVDEDALLSQIPRREPRSALEHFERAVEKEAEGNLGDSLHHYRKAYRLDSAVDRTYRNKHFAAAWKKSTHAPKTSIATDAPASGQGSQDEPVVLPTPELIASFAHLPIPRAEPEIEGTPPPPCPIANIPSEVLLVILRHVALMDPASFCRVALVCKRLAYHFAHEQHIWKRLCQGSEFGFKSMHYSFACDILGNPEYTMGQCYTPFPFSVPVQIPKPLSSWSQVFQMFPRIRFTGVYLSTVNYTRPGAASSYHNISWDSPIHIVTYYRYLRFYPDGSVISILTTAEPLDVVPHISKENMKAARATFSHRHHQRNTSEPGITLAGAAEPIPPVAMSALKEARRGRWHLVKPLAASESEDDNRIPSVADCPPFPVKTVDTPALDPRDVVIETEGVGSKYMYTMHLSLRSSSGGSKPANPTATPANTSKNTKLVWKGFWSHNQLTDDWAEFGLRNDRAFVFRRVRGWGM
jgi:F-box protein 9